MLDISNLEHQHALADGHCLSLVFVFDGVAYYFDTNAIFDSTSTVCIDIASGEISDGTAANTALVNAITLYGYTKGDVWIAPDFRDHVANIVAKHQ